MATQHYHARKAAEKIIETVGKQIVIGVPIGIGKPIKLLNALYELASVDASLQLTIITGLTLARPVLHSELERRLLDPILTRLLKDHEDPLYEKMRVQQLLPSNIEVIEFFLTPGKYLHNDYVQQHYISSNYTQVVRDSTYYSINVLAQQITCCGEEQYSLSCNTDLFHDTIMQLKKSGKNFAVVGEINLNLPVMYGEEAIVAASVFTDILDSQPYPTLFSLPPEALSLQEHLIGLYASCLVEDNGCLQIGIGQLSIALAHALILRQQKNAEYIERMQHLNLERQFSRPVTSVFNKGLYALTEMLSDEYMHLYKNNIIKKRVYDHSGLQHLLNVGVISEKITDKTLSILLEHKIIQNSFTEADFAFLQKFGILQETVQFRAGYLYLPSGECVIADLHNSADVINTKFLGTHLICGKCMHAGFFLGSADFYQALRDLTPQDHQQIQMTSISRTNSLDWNPTLSRLQRVGARFINSAMMITLGGEIITDTLYDLREVSGVGGQFDFIDMSQKLPDARSIILCRSTRETRDGLKSNIIWDYPHLTVPRYLRDIIVTEYGIADCRSKTDAEVIKCILNIADSRFQTHLLQKAKQSGKLPSDYTIPLEFQNNTPERLAAFAREQPTYFTPYPFGSDFTSEEQVLLKVLMNLKYQSRFKLFILSLSALFCRLPNKPYQTLLQRMNLTRPGNLKQFMYKRLIKFIVYQHSLI